MKNLKVILGLSLLMSVALVSCEEEKAEELEENLPSEEVSGDARDRFVGDWSVSETSTVHGSRNYTLTMVKDSSFPDRVNVYNFYLYGDGDSVRANISSVLVDVITIPEQTANNSVIEGSGEMADNETTINVDFTVDDGNDIDTVSAVWVK